MSREVFEFEYRPQLPAVAIQILDQNQLPFPRSPHGVISRLRLVFADVCEENCGVEPGTWPMLGEAGAPVLWDVYLLPDLAHTRRIVRFLAHYATKPQELELAVHCHAGVSRSAAVAAFAAERYRAPLVGSNTCTVYANLRVTRLLRRADAEFRDAAGSQH